MEKAKILFKEYIYIFDERMMELGENLHPQKKINRKKEKWFGYPPIPTFIKWKLTFFRYPRRPKLSRTFSSGEERQD